MSGEIRDAVAMTSPHSRHSPYSPDEHSRPGPAGAAVVGLAIGLLMCLLNVLVLFRTGTGFGGSALTVLLAAALLRLWRRLSWGQLFIAFSVASSGYFATAALDSGIAAVKVRGDALPSAAVLIAVAVAANVAGVGLGAVVARFFVEREKLPYPTLQPAIALMESATSAAPRRTAALALWSAVGAAVALGAVLLGWEGGPQVAGLPAYLSVAVSPLLVGLGILIGVRPALWLAAGAAYTVLIWAWQEHRAHTTVTFDTHIGYPWVLAFGVGLVIGHSLMSLGRVRRPLSHAVGDARRWRPAVLGVSAVAAVGVLLTVLTSPRAGRIVATAAVGVALLALWVLFLNRAGGEVGIAPLAPVLYLSALLFALLGLASSVTLLTAAVVCSAAVASLYYTYAVKIASRAPEGQAVSRRRVGWTQTAGGAVGAAVGVGLVLLIIAANGSSSETFPIPIAHALGFVDAAARGSTGYGSAVGVAALIGGVAGALLSFTSALPTMIGLGILIPPAYSLAIVIGGLTRWQVERRRPDAKASLENGASGLIIGEGLIMIVVIGIRAVVT